MLARNYRENPTSSGSVTQYSFGGQSHSGTKLLGLHCTQTPL
jgi:hypothetical protein